VTKVITCLNLDQFQQTWYQYIPKGLRNLIIPRLSKSVKIEASYGLCHQVKFRPGVKFRPRPLKNYTFTLLSRMGILNFNKFSIIRFKLIFYWRILTERMFEE
jgi:hypothetical protein